MAREMPYRFSEVAFDSPVEILMSSAMKSKHKVHFERGDIELCFEERGIATALAQSRSALLPVLYGAKSNMKEASLHTRHKNPVTALKSFMKDARRAAIL